MKCPLRYKIEKHAATFVEFEFPDCLKEECTWWSSQFSRCIVKSLGEDIGFINDKLTRIAKELTLIRPK